MWQVRAQFRLFFNSGSHGLLAEQSRRTSQFLFDKPWANPRFEQLARARQLNIDYLPINLTIP
ncbi:hypothetical protein HYN24_14520 [Dechloromonas sp. HYN0024]|nr:hypothetical protein HYN24_14520 [Dechloromonas sp. HYN0024]